MWEGLLIRNPFFSIGFKYLSDGFTVWNLNIYFVSIHANTQIGTPASWKTQVWVAQIMILDNLHHIQISQVVFSPEDKFMINHREFVKGSLIAGTKRNNITSWIWNHGIEIVEISNGKKFWKCTLRKKPVLYNRSSTDHPMKVENWRRPGAVLVVQGEKYLEQMYFSNKPPVKAVSENYDHQTQLK